MCTQLTVLRIFCINCFDLWWYAIMFGFIHCKRSLFYMYYFCILIFDLDMEINKWNEYSEVVCWVANSVRVAYSMLVTLTYDRCDSATCLTRWAGLIGRVALDVLVVRVWPWSSASGCVVTDLYFSKENLWAGNSLSPLYRSVLPW